MTDTKYLTDLAFANFKAFVDDKVPNTAKVITLSTSWNKSDISTIKIYDGTSAVVAFNLNVNFPLGNKGSRQWNRYLYEIRCYINCNDFTTQRSNNKTFNDGDSTAIDEVKFVNDCVKAMKNAYKVFSDEYNTKIKVYGHGKALKD